MNNVRKQNSCRSPSIFSKCLSCQNFCVQSSLSLTSNSHNTLNITILHVVQIFSKRERKKPTHCLFSSGFFFFFEGAGEQETKQELWKLQKLSSPKTPSPRITAHSYHFSEELSYVFYPLLGTAMSSNKFHSLDSPELASSTANQDITGYVSTLSNAGLCCDILSKTELFVSRTGTSVTELYCSTASKGQSQNGLGSQAWRNKLFLPLFLILFAQLKNLHFPSLHHQSLTYCLCQKIYTLWGKSPKAKVKTESNLNLKYINQYFFVPVTLSRYSCIHCTAMLIYFNAWFIFYCCKAQQL